jgi:hypothetical protein
MHEAFADHPEHQCGVLKMKSGFGEDGIAG